MIFRRQTTVAFHPQRVLLLWRWACDPFHWLDVALLIVLLKLCDFAVRATEHLWTVPFAWIAPMRWSLLCVIAARYIVAFRGVDDP